MKILIISNSEWDDNNSFGNSFSNILGGIEDIEIANIYCRTGIPNTDSCHHFFQINEKLLLQNLFDHHYPSGQIVYNNSNLTSSNILTRRENNILSFVKKKRWIIFFWLRDLIWMIGRWESKELYDFTENFKPQIIFLPIYQLNYINKMALKLKQRYHIPMVAYVSDDEYTLRQFSLSPFYWLNRLFKRRWVKKVIDQCEKLYVISEIQKSDYDKCFGKDCRILFKGGDFNREAPLKNGLSDPIIMVYAGNLGNGRYKSLSLIGKGLDKINHNSLKAKLYIYSQTPLNRQMKLMLNKKSIEFNGSVPHEKLLEIYKNADILVHTESFTLKERLQVRQSFSTKIVDYFYSARCIFAIGPRNIASIDYLINNNGAIVITKQNEIEEKIELILKQPDLIKEYAKKAWDCGRKNHQIKNIQSFLTEELKSLV